tara:strand:+ start:920 stop:1045 length:126 start_codon:yes stop_codon:yes gene_type:complete
VKLCGLEVTMLSDGAEGTRWAGGWGMTIGIDQPGEGKGVCQ